MMWDPISLFYLMLVMNMYELPAGRLQVNQAIAMRENTVIVDTINKQIELRQGL